MATYVLGLKIDEVSNIWKMKNVIGITQFTGDFVLKDSKEEVFKSREEFLSTLQGSPAFLKDIQNRLCVLEVKEVNID